MAGCGRQADRTRPGHDPGTRPRSRPEEIRYPLAAKSALFPNGRTTGHGRDWRCRRAAHPPPIARDASPRGAGRDVSNHRGRGVGAPHRHRPVEPARARQRLRSGHARRARPGVRGARRRRGGAHRGPARQRASLLHRRRPGGAGPPQRRAPAAAHASLRDVLAALDALPKPTLALVHGAAVGGGAAFAACCDAVIATDDAFFSIPEVRVGMPPLGVAPFLVRAIGHRQFRRYGLSGERIAAAEALRLGLAHQVCAADALEDDLGRHRRRVPARRAGRHPHAQERGRPICIAGPGGGAGHAGAARLQDPGGAGGDRELPREAQAELVSAMSRTRTAVLAVRGGAP